MTTTLLDLAESGARALGDAQIDRTAGIVHNTVVITAVSANGPNGRMYSEKALRQIAQMAEGIPAYANHVKDPADAFKPRDIRDLVGRHRNVRYDATRNRVVSDLHLVEHHREMVLGLVATVGDLIGNSLVSRGLARIDAAGKQIIEEVVAVRSADLVTDPATTKGLFEHREHTISQEGTLMDNAHARLAVAIRGGRWFDYDGMKPTPREMQEQRGREERNQPVTLPADAHQTMLEAIRGESTPVSVENAHARLRRAVTR